MTIQVREPEPTVTLELDRLRALELYLVLVDAKDQVATEEGTEIIEDIIKDLRQFLVSRR